MRGREGEGIARKFGGCLDPASNYVLTLSTPESSGWGNPVSSPRLPFHFAGLTEEGGWSFESKRKKEEATRYRIEPISRNRFLAKTTFTFPRLPLGEIRPARGRPGEALETAHARFDPLPAAHSPIPPLKRDNVIRLFADFHPEHRVGGINGPGYLVERTRIHRDAFYIYYNLFILNLPLSRSRGPPREGIERDGNAMDRG